MIKYLLPIVLALGFAGVATAASTPYCYPTGSYWQTQIAAYPDYYAANNAYYLAKYGTPKYCQ